MAMVVVRESTEQGSFLAGRELGQVVAILATIFCGTAAHPGRPSVVRLAAVRLTFCCPVPPSCRREHTGRCLVFCTLLPDGALSTATSSTQFWKLCYICLAENRCRRLNDRVCMPIHIFMYIYSIYSICIYILLLPPHFQEWISVGSYG